MSRFVPKLCPTPAHSSAFQRTPAHDTMGACLFIATFTRTYSGQGLGLKILCSYPPLVVSPGPGRRPLLALFSYQYAGQCSHACRDFTDWFHVPVPKTLLKR